MAAENSGGHGGLKTETAKAHYKSNSYSSTHSIGTAVATTMKKKGTMGAKKEEEHIKLVFRRLPPGLTKEELWDQMQPLLNEPLAFWFCPAPKNTDLQLPLVATFARAYIAFREEKDAVALAERFNGYVFVDKQGNESMAIVECAPSQHLPKDLNRPAKECDARTGTLENEMQYQQFLEEYEQKMAMPPRRVIDFDALVRELEEKERRMQSGQVQETPLTAYISKMGMEKCRKKQQKLIDRLERRLQQQQQNSSHQIVTTDWAKVYRKEGIENVSSDGGGGGRKKEDKKEQKTAANITKKQKIAARMEKFANWQERKERNEGQYSNSTNIKTIADAKRTVKKESKTSAAEVKNGKSHDQNGGDGKEMQKEERGRNLSGNAVGEGVISKSKSSPKPIKKSITNQNSDAAKPTKKSTTAGRNRDRPEREIYRPGKARLQSRKSAEPTTPNSRDDPCDVSNSKLPQEQQK